jgi:hypothetical protein
MKKKNKNNLYFSLGSIGIFILGCTSLTVTPVYTPLPEQIDKSPFTGVPCEAPCWYGLEVGKSNESEVVAVLPSLTFVDQESIQMYRRPSVPDYYVELYGPGVEIVGDCVNSNKDCLALTISNDILQEINVKFNYKIKPTEAINFLDDPDFIGYANFGTERIMCEVYLIWSKKRLVLTSRFEDFDGLEKYCNVVRDEEKIPSSLLISEALYLSDVKLSILLSPVTGKIFEFTGTIPDK